MYIIIICPPVVSRFYASLCLLTILILDGLLNLFRLLNLDGLLKLYRPLNLYRQWEREEKQHMPKTAIITCQYFRSFQLMGVGSFCNNWCQMLMRGYSWRGLPCIVTPGMAHVVHLTEQMLQWGRSMLLAWVPSWLPNAWLPEYWNFFVLSNFKFVFTPEVIFCT